MPENTSQDSTKALRQIHHSNTTLMYYDIQGIKLPHDDKIISHNIKNAIKHGSYEKREADQLKQIIQKRERILEIGGGIGFISSIAAKNELVEKICVVEANPGLIGYMQVVHELNNVANVADMEIVNGVLTNNVKRGKYTEFYVRENFWASSLSPGHKYARKEQVRTYSFNAMIERVRPTLIICDIEGGEIELFENANLSHVEKVLIELHQWSVGRRNMKKIFDYFSARDFHYDQHHSNGSVVLFSHVDRDNMRKKRLAVAKKQKELIG